MKCGLFLQDFDHFSHFPLQKGDAFPLSERFINVPFEATGTLFYTSMSEKPTSKSNGEYWRSNLNIVGILMGIWFIVSYGCGILFVDQLNKIQLGGFKLGFWFAQQGSIYVFVILIAVYVRMMSKLDKKYGSTQD